MEILKPEQYGEYEAFVSSHPNGEFTQSINWQKARSATCTTAMCSPTSKRARTSLPANTTRICSRSTPMSR